jgi:hypothetical protein
LRALAGSSSVVDDVLRRAIERDAGGAGYGAHLLHGTVTDAALGRVDDALKRQIVVGLTW